MRCARHGRKCSEPPAVVTCPADSARYLIRQLVGKGGFARVYRVAHRHQPDHPNPLTFETLTSSSADSDPNLSETLHSPPTRGEHGSLRPSSRNSSLAYTHYALKVISKCRLGESSAGRDALRNELAIHHQLEHPQIVPLISFWEDDFRLYLLMPLVEGPSLEHFVRSRGKLSELEVSFYASHIFKALAYLHHNRIVHRDLKLANFLLSRDLSNVQLCDFGLAANIDSLHLSNISSVCGTPNYVAPELLTSTVNSRQIHRKVLSANAKFSTKKVGYTFSADMWSMGVALFTMLTGSGPFDSEDLPRTFRRIRTARFTFPIGIKLSAAAKSFVRSLLAEDLTKRLTVDQALRHPFLARSEISKALQYPTVCHVPHLEVVRSRLATPSRREHPGHLDYHKDASQFSNQSAPKHSRDRLSETPSFNLQQKGPSKRGEWHIRCQQNSVPVQEPHREKADHTLAKAVSERHSSLCTPHGRSERRKKEPSDCLSTSRRNYSSKTTRSYLNDRTLNGLKRIDDSAGIFSSSRCSSLLASEQRDDIVELSVTLSRALIRGRKFLDDDKMGRAAIGKRQRFQSVIKEVSSVSKAPPLVKRWLDYTSKYGFATLMEDGRIGCCFNDGSIMFFVSELSEVPDVAYIPGRGNSNIKDGKGVGNNEQPSDISKKACLCTLFADMILDGGRGSMYDLPSACNVSFLKPEADVKNQIPLSSSEDLTGIVHVREWLRFRNFQATAFRLSNNTIHVKFDVGEVHCDDYVFNPIDSTLFYREAQTCSAWLCDVKYLGEFSSHSEYIHAQLQICSQAISRFLEF